MSCGSEFFGIEKSLISRDLLFFQGKTWPPVSCSDEPFPMLVAKIISSFRAVVDGIGTKPLRIRTEGDGEHLPSPVLSRSRQFAIA